ncbi:Transcriptional regulator/sugar kinase [Candidatus Burkholderia pumila]|uniref:Transcriptional regulator/sugar kinase n=1 Tax=Candidatus Burkholderia pumila TaxID=1090375 RepID=A0ABR5HMN9_9BURK|nr:Transcriptional regulator/sugar kinase [Candidatus Burkholderia pumila]
MKPASGRGSNSANVRRYNERLLLQALRRNEPASKADLARHANLTSTAVGSIVEALANAGLIETLGRRHDGQRGQPASLIRLDPRGAFGIGVRLDRTSIETVLVNFAGDVLARSAVDSVLPHPAAALKIVQRDVEKMLDLLSADERERLTGIGVAQPFNLGSWLRELGLPDDTFCAWDNANFADDLSRALSLRVFSENDGNAAATAELFYGHGRQCDDFIYLFIGSAIGGGIAIDGDCLRGVTGNAGDIGVIPVPPSRLPSAPQPTGPWDILLSRASLNALVRHLSYSGAVADNRIDLQACIERRLPAVDEWIDDCIEALAPALRSTLCVLDVPMVVIDSDIDGGLLDKLLDRLTATMTANAPEARGMPALVRGSFGPDAGALGAATLPMFFNFSPRAGVRHAGFKLQEVNHAA